MARSFGRKVMDFLWGPVDEDYPETYGEYDGEPEYEPDEPADEQPAPRSARRGMFGRGSGEVVEMQPCRSPRIEMRYPRSFKEVEQLADVVKQGACLMIDIEQVEDKDRSRLVNFLFGVAYGRDGHARRLNDMTFVFAPRHFDVEADKPVQDVAVDDPGYMPRFARTG